MVNFPADDVESLNIMKGQRAYGQIECLGGEVDVFYRESMVFDRSIVCFFLLQTPASSLRDRPRLPTVPAVRVHIGNANLIRNQGQERFYPLDQEVALEMQAILQLRLVLQLNEAFAYNW